MALLCRLLNHRRSKSGTRLDLHDGTQISHCRRCNAVLIREPGDSWIVADAA